MRSSVNVIVVVLDDMGFADLGCYGSAIRTPNIDAVAESGLRYTGFHVAALCAPTRASILTGRNHHAVGMGMLPQWSSNRPAYSGMIPRSAATLARHLKDAGYATFGVGKWHLMPRRERGITGPFDRWPLGMGFERFYGFVDGMTDQWFPRLVRDNSFVDPPARPKDGYHLTSDLVDESIAMIGDHQAARREKPFFLYLAPGAMHSPHQAPPEYIEAYRGAFDHGWDEERSRRFERQRRSGIIPADTENTERPDSVPAWDSLTDEQKKVRARQMEVYAGFLTHTDHQIGRLLQHLRASELWDDTLIVVTSDNGAAPGPPDGVWSLLGSPDVATMVDRLDDLGGPDTFPHYAPGWAWAGNTPLRYWKALSWLGGVRAPLVIGWPSRITADERGAIRVQFAHAIDLTPTILELAHVTPAEVVDGVIQQPIDGTSLASTIDDPQSPTRSTQYFEMVGSRAIYHEGWKATSGDHLPPGEFGAAAEDDGERWSLFDLTTDFSEARDLADLQPDRVQRLIGLWEKEAHRNGVLPVIRTWERPGDPADPPADLTEWPRDHYVCFPGGSPLEVTGLMGDRAVSLLLDLDIPDVSVVEGVLWAYHLRLDGAYLPRPAWACHVIAGRPVLSWGVSAPARLDVPIPLPRGRVRLETIYRPVNAEFGVIDVTVDDERVHSAAVARVDLTTALVADIGGLLVGRGRGTRWDDYDPERTFAGVIHSLRLEVSDAS